MHKVSVITEGMEISGWNTVNISRSLSQFADSFKIGFSDVWTDKFPDVYVGLQCKIQIDGTTVITGNIEAVEPSFTGETIKYEISGYSLTKDLVDCDRIEKPFSWKNVDLYQVSKKICEPFGINVTIEASSPGPKFTEVSVNQGESLYDFLNKLAVQRGFLMITSLDGGLIYTNAGKYRAVDSLIQGENIAEFKGQFSFANRFSDYVIKGQQKVKADENSWTDKTISIFSKVQDLGVGRYRPKMMTADTQVDLTTAKKQAAWEAQIREGRSTRFSIKVPDWVQSNGNLWRENEIVYIKVPVGRLDGDYLVETVDYNFQSTTEQTFTECEMGFVNKNTYNANPKDTIKKPSKPKGKYGWIS